MALLRSRFCYGVVDWEVRFGVHAASHVSLMLRLPTFADLREYVDALLERFADILVL